jgi:hypothetical protein
MVSAEQATAVLADVADTLTDALSEWGSVTQAHNAKAAQGWMHSVALLASSGRATAAEALAATVTEFVREMTNLVDNESFAGIDVGGISAAQWVTNWEVTELGHAAKAHTRAQTPTLFDKVIDTGPYAAALYDSAIRLSELSRALDAVTALARQGQFRSSALKALADWPESQSRQAIVRPLAVTAAYDAMVSALDPQAAPHAFGRAMLDMIDRLGEWEKSLAGQPVVESGRQVNVMQNLAHIYVHALSLRSNFSLELVRLRRAASALIELSSDSDLSDIQEVHGVLLKRWSEVQSRVQHAERVTQALLSAPEIAPPSADGDIPMVRAGAAALSDSHEWEAIEISAVVWLGIFESYPRYPAYVQGVLSGMNKNNAEIERNGTMGASVPAGPVTKDFVREAVDSIRTWLKDAT